MNEIVQIISTVGFPIAACLLCGWYIFRTNDEHREEIAKLNEQHKEEILKMTEAVNNNTIALTRLCDQMEKEYKEVNENVVRM